MIAAIAWQEARSLLRDGRLPAFGAVVGLLLVAVLFAAAQQRGAAETGRLQAEQAARAQWDHQGDRNPHRAAHFGLYAFKPRAALSVVEPGVDRQLGQALWLEPHKRNMALFAPAADEAPSLGLGGLTPGFVLFALVPLLIAVLGHGTVIRERERGTLRLLQACGVDGVRLVAGKWLGLSLAVALVLLPALALGAWLSVDRSGRAAAGWLGAGLGIYYATWAAATVLVSTLARSARSALLVLSALWVAGVFLVPRLAASVVDQATPLPTGAAFRAAIHHDIEHGLPGDGSARQRLQDFDAALLADAGVQRLDDLPYGANARRRLFRDAYATRVHALHFQRLWEAQQRQQRLLRWAGALGPFVPMRAVGSALAQTDLAHRRHFEEAAEAYRQRFTTWIDDWDLRATRGVTSFESRYAGDAQWQAMPSWRYTPPDTAFSLRSAAADGSLLVAWCAAALGALVVAGRRLKP